MDSQQVRKLLHKHILKHYDGRQARFAEFMGVSRAYINTLLHKDVSIPLNILNVLGLEKRVSFHRKRK